MEGRTPYNSIYATLQSEKRAGETIVCCTHGQQCGDCTSSTKSDATSSAASKKSKRGSRRGNVDQEQLISELTDKLANMSSKSKTKQEKKHQRDELLNVSAPPECSRSSKTRTKSCRSERARVRLSNTIKEPSTLMRNNSTPFVGINLRHMYVGVLTSDEAETKVQGVSDFRLYHLVSSSNREPDLDCLDQYIPLMVVYRASPHIYRHYAVRTRHTGSHVQFYVDYGDPKVPGHPSINHLVKYYQIHVHVNPMDEANVGPFPWWEV